MYDDAMFCKQTENIFFYNLDSLDVFGWSIYFKIEAKDLGWHPIVTMITDSILNNTHLIINSTYATIKYLQPDSSLFQSS